MERLLEGINSRAVAPLYKKATVVVDTTEAGYKNNYSRPDGQNVGNHVTGAAWEGRFRGERGFGREKGEGREGGGEEDLT